MKDLKISRETQEADGSPVQVLRVEGFVDAHTVPEFEDFLTGVIGEGYVNLLLNLQDLNYINSTGLGLLMSVYRQVKQGGGNLVIANMSDKIHNIFNLLGFSRLIRTYSDEGSALASFASG